MDLRDVSSKYEDDDSEGDARRFRRKSSPGLFSATRIFMLFLLIIGIVIGSFVQHQYVEPLLNKQFIAENDSLQTLTKLLNEQNDKLLIDLNACREGIDLNVESSCQSMHDEIENDIDESNYCSEDADCDVLILGGSYIEFGCYHFINKAIDKEPFYNKMDTYTRQCSTIIDLCAPGPNPKCVSGKCVSGE
ncbi:MAG: hypothetical protein HYW05_04470 [Candidatus Diapherotrites archaeon]|nr:hypothetical protein [Candidatus Diapherotrites archaeon]